MLIETLVALALYTESSPELDRHEVTLIGSVIVNRAAAIKGPSWATRRKKAT
jgi:hypothetical protein